MAKFDGCRLMILGSNLGYKDIIGYAKSHGAFTLAVDYLEPEKSPAKLMADEHYLCSTADTDSLLNLIKEYKITAVFSGISEFNILQAMKVCKIAKLPFYCTKSQWDLIDNKDTFRKLCQIYNVSTPKTYYMGNSENINYDKLLYPLIIKPVDGSASRGISICYSSSDINNAVLKALEISTCKNIIIEEYVEGEEFTASYTIVNGDVTLSCVDYSYQLALNGGNVTTIPIARIYPSPYTKDYIDQVNDSVIELIKSLNLKTSTIFVQGIYNNHLHRFYIFEAGLRPEGTMPYRFINAINGVNFMNNLIDVSLLGTCEKGNYIDDPFFKGQKCLILSIASKGGVISRYEGIEKVVRENPEIIDYECRYLPGSMVPYENTMKQIVLRFIILGSSIEQIKSKVKSINNNVFIYNPEGLEISVKFNPELL